ncbi:MAG TPA: DNA-3-methyladenine glycosylase 2 family protein [Actinomycetota bacterium]
MRRRVAIPDPYSLAATLGPLQHGAYDPTVLFEGAIVWRAFRIGGAAVTVRYERVAGGVDVDAWGEAAEEAIDAAPATLGLDDDPSTYVPHHAMLKDLHRRHPGMRMTATAAIFEALIPAVLEQRVTGREATSAWAAIVRRYGEPAPGPAPLKVAPSPERLATLPYSAMHPCGVERARADTIRRACSRAGRIREAAAMTPADARRRLRALPGIGVWTAAEVTRVTHGDADCVSVGDFHVKNVVAWALAGEPRGTDERMLELLAPEGGHRGRAVRLLEIAGIAPPAFGPRHRRRDIASL